MPQQLPEWTSVALRRRAIRAPINPMDKSTVVSIFPKKIDEVKHTIQPGRFILEPGSYEKPTVLVVGSSSWWKEYDEQQPLLEIPHGSTQIADSVVRDWANGILACNMDDIMPGVFWVPGEYTSEQVKLDLKVRLLLEKADMNQKRWYRELAKIGDILWSRSNGNPLAISDEMRLAASQLGLDKPWTKDFSAIELKNCPACGVLRNNNFPVCNVCHHVVDLEMYEKLGLKKAI